VPEEIPVEGYGWAVIPSTGIAVALGKWGNRSLEGRRVPVDEAFYWDSNKNKWVVISGFYHFAFKDSYDYNKRLLAAKNLTDQNAPNNAKEYFEFQVEDYVYHVRTKGTLDTIELNLEVMVQLLTRYNWMEIRKSDSEVSRGFYWSQSVEDYIETLAFRITLLDAVYDTSNNVYKATFKFEKGSFDEKTLTATYTETLVDSLDLYPAVGHYDRDTTDPNTIDLTEDVSLEDIYDSCYVRGADGSVVQSPSNPKCFVQILNENKDAWYTILLFLRKWTVEGTPSYAVKVKNGYAVYDSDKGIYIGYPEVLSDLARVVLYSAMFKVLGTNVPEVLDRLFVDIKEIIVELDPAVSYSGVKVY